MLFLAVLVGGYGLLHLWQRLRREQRESIDIDAVIDAKYPNRVKRDNWLERAADDRVGDIYAMLDDEHGDSLDEAIDDDVTAGDDAGAGHDEPLDDDEAAASAVGSYRAALAPGEDHDGEPPSDAPVAPPRLVPSRAPRPLGPQDPLPGEPDIDGYALPAPHPTVTVAERDGFVGDPYEMLRDRRDRIATQVAEAFREVHKLRTESLRRASQAEHNASLAASARTRAGRMVRDSRAVEAQGRFRPDNMPTADDAFDDVHRFRTAALKRAQQAEHGAQSVSQSRERAARLLAEQREIEAEMARLQRLRAVVRPQSV
jgi:hypothetical protein